MAVRNRSGASTRACRVRAPRCRKNALTGVGQVLHLPWADPTLEALVRRAVLVLALTLPNGTLHAQDRSCSDPQLSMVELGACMDSAYAQADRELNTAYRAALAALTDTAQRAALVKAQRAWIAFRDAEGALWFTYAGGNHPSMFVLPTEIAFTRARAEFLWGLTTSNDVPREPGIVPWTPQTAAPAARPNPIDEQLLVIAMKFDLRTLVTAEEAFFAESVRYTPNLARLRFRQSADNTPPQITLVGQGWVGVIGNPRTRITCTIFVGTAPRAPATAEGAPACQYSLPGHQ